MARPYFMRRAFSFGPTFINASLDGKAWEQLSTSEKANIELKCYQLRGLYGSEPLSDGKRPTALQIKGNHKSIGAMFMTYGSIIMVQQPMKDLIEELEPDVHEFWSIEVELKSGELYDVPCYGFRSLHQIDAVIPDKSHLKTIEDHPGLFNAKEARTKTRAYFEMTLDHEAISGSHIWNEKKFLTGDLFFSETIRSEARSRKLKIFALDRLKVV